MSDQTKASEIKEAVRDSYGTIARQVAGGQRASCCGPSASSAPAACCGPDTALAGRQPALARRPGDNARFLYTGPVAATLPDSVTGAALGCGDPTAIADLQPGQVVLDLGSGGGIDCFLAARRVGPTGRVIGLDMTPDMIRLAQQNAKKMGADNVEFRLGEIEDIPLPDASVDVIISNCVVNLSPDKDAVFREAHRVLRPGGTLSISDMVVTRPLPEPIRQRVEAWASCIAGALVEDDYLNRIRLAGFADVDVRSRDYLSISRSAAGDDQLLTDVASALSMDVDDVRRLMQESNLQPADLVSLVASIRVTARK
jgi:SAM-dependent methyltransferase